MLVTWKNIICLFVLLGCGPNASFEQTKSNKNSTSKQNENASPENTDTEQEPTHEDADQLAAPPQVITGAYLTEIDCGASDLPDSEKSKTIGCRAQNFDLAQVELIVKIKTPENNDILLQKMSDDNIGVIWQVYFKIPNNISGDSKFVIQSNEEEIDSFEIPIQDIFSRNNEMISSEIEGKKTGALLTNAYRIPQNTTVVPKNIDQLPLIGTYYLSYIELSSQPVEKGFLGNKELKEWFALDIHSNILLTKECLCEFELNSDDGSQLLIDGKMIIDNNGIHPPIKATGAIKLNKGLHKFQLKYFQGPKETMALELRWRFDSTSDFHIVPPGAFTQKKASHRRK
ncbi:MAG: PA14 domain-containing protein [Bdellovibrionota bacterium]